MQRNLLKVWEIYHRSMYCLAQMKKNVTLQLAFFIRYAAWFRHCMTDKNNFLRTCLNKPKKLMGFCIHCQKLASISNEW